MKIQRQREAFAYRFALELTDEEAAAFDKYVKENGGKIPATLGKPEKVKPIPPEVLDQMMEDPYFFEDSGPDDWYGGQGRKWYHVSPNEMDEGTVLVPGGIDGKATSQDFYDMGFGDDTGTLADMGGGRNTHVWLTPDLDDAHFWAAALNAPNIYEVTPDDDPEPWNGTGVDGWVSRGGKIHRRVAFLPKSDDDPALYTREIPSINPAEALRDHPVVRGFQEYLDAGLAPEDPLHAMEEYLGYYHPQDRIYYDLLQRYIGEPVTDSYPFPPTKGAPALPKEPYAEVTYPPGYELEYDDPRPGAYYARRRRAISDQTRFQQDFAEDQQSGEPLDEQQKRFIEYFRRFDDMASNARGEYTPRGGWPQ